MTGVSIAPGGRISHFPGMLFLPRIYTPIGNGARRVDIMNGNLTAPGIGAFEKFWNEGLTPDEFAAELAGGSCALCGRFRDDYSSFAPDTESIAALEAWPDGLRAGIITENWCEDSANFVPPILKFLTHKPSLDVRIFWRDGFLELRDANLTGGKAKIPVVAVMDESFAEIARFVERPPTLNRWLSKELGERKWLMLTPEERQSWKPLIHAQGKILRGDAVKYLARAVSENLAKAAEAV